VSAPGAEDRPVREEDTFDVDAVDAWLRAAGVAGLGDGAPAVRQFTGGASNLTYLLRYPERDLILRRPPAGTKARSAHDMAREHRIQSLLRPSFPYLPEMVALCTEQAVIGRDFYVMERVEGVTPRAEMPPEVGTDPARMAAHLPGMPTRAQIVARYGDALRATVSRYSGCATYVPSVATLWRS
jgi:aminoglycoside phosphotransferase (APT) family kinase protein